jgi:tetratricopeptide (TPR) repeat protein
VPRAAAARKQAPPAPPPRRLTPALAAGLLFALALAAHASALRGGFVWDDDDYVTANRTLRSLDGLGRIWFEPGAVPQYYPLTFTSLWLEYRAWGPWPAGYHATNVVLHGLAAVLLWGILAALAVPGAWLGAALFAVHPVGVESVAWVTERKNVLSALLALAALRVYLPLAGLGGRPVRGGYALALACFTSALLAKTVVCVLPVVVLLLVWWKRGRIGMRDVVPLLPFFALGLGLALVTVWMEKTHVGARGEAWNLSLVDRTLVAGRALWFYAAKLAWPQRLTFIYPRWQIDAGTWWQYLFPAAAGAVAAGLFAARARLGRGPFVAVAIYAVTLAPALGFIDVYPMRYSFVADHFQYHASAALLALAGAGVTQLRPPPAASAALLGVLGVLAWWQGRIYASVETLWSDTLAKNPACAMAHINLGMHLAQSGRNEAAIAHYTEALRLEPGAVDALNNLGNALAAAGRLADARAAFAEALRHAPGDAPTLSNLGNAFAAEGRLDEALEQYAAAVRADPRFADAHNNFANALARAGRTDEAAREYAEALRLDPEYGDAHHNLGVLLVAAGRDADAIPHLAAAARVRPDSAELQHALGMALAASGQRDAAAAAYGRALALRPAYADAHNDLGVLLAESGQMNEAAEHFAEAVRLEPGHAQARDNLDLARAATVRAPQGR